MTDKQLLEALTYFRELAHGGPQVTYHTPEKRIREIFEQDKADLLVQLSKLIQEAIAKQLKRDEFAEVRKFLATIGSPSQEDDISPPPGSQSENAPE